MCIEVPNLVIYNSNLRHRYMAIRLLWLLSNKGLLRLHILFLFCNCEMWTWNRFSLLVVLFLFFRNSLRILWEASCKTAKFSFVSGSQPSYDLGPCMDLGTVNFGVVNFSNFHTWLKDYSGPDASRDMANCLFLIISNLVVFYRHAESCQFVAFVTSYSYRRIWSTRGRRVASLRHS